jgi:hypothetical protein
MFASADVRLVLRKFSVGIEENEDGDTVRLCTTTFRVPRLSYELARGVLVAPVAQHCFDPQEERPFWTVKEVKFGALPTCKYTVTLKTAPDLETPSAELLLAELTELRVWRPKKDARDLALEFVVEHEVARADARELGDLLTMMEISRGTALCCTFSEVQLELLEAPPRGTVQ